VSFVVMVLGLVVGECVGEWVVVVVGELPLTRDCAVLCCAVLCLFGLVSILLNTVWDGGHGGKTTGGRGGEKMAEMVWAVPALRRPPAPVRDNRVGLMSLAAAALKRPRFGCGGVYLSALTATSSWCPMNPL
jgi:hypothetical protein